MDEPEEAHKYLRKGRSLYHETHLSIEENYSTVQIYEGTVEDEIELMREAHGELKTKILVQVQINGVSFGDMATFVVGRTGIDLNSPQFQHRGAKIDNTEDLFYYLHTKGYMPFYSLTLLEGIVNEFAEECHLSLDEYKVKYLKPFLQRKLFELIGNQCFDHEKVDGQVQLSIKVDRDWDTTNFENVFELTKEVSSILGIPSEHLVFEAVNKGCIEIVLRIMAHDPRQCPVEDLSDSQRHQLGDQRVKQLVCGGVTLLENKERRRLKARILASKAFVVGAPGSTFAVGGPGSTFVVGAPGSTFVVGAPGSTFVVGGPGSTFVVGGPGSTFVVGGPGSTFAVGGPGSTFAVGAPGSTFVVGAPGSTFVVGGPGSTFVVGAPRSTFVVGAPGSTFAVGGPGIYKPEGKQENSIRIFFTDTGGQPEFHELLTDTGGQPEFHELLTVICGQPEFHKLLSILLSLQELQIQSQMQSGIQNSSRNLETMHRIKLVSLVDTSHITKLEALIRVLGTQKKNFERERETQKETEPDQKCRLTSYGFNNLICAIKAVQRNPMKVKSVKLETDHQSSLNNHLAQKYHASQQEVLSKPTFNTVPFFQVLTKDCQDATIVSLLFANQVKTLLERPRGLEPDNATLHKTIVGTQKSLIGCRGDQIVMKTKGKPWFEERTMLRAM